MFEIVDFQFGLTVSEKKLNIDELNYPFLGSVIEPETKKSVLVVFI